MDILEKLTKHKAPQTETITVRLSKETLNELTTLCTSSNVSRNALIAELITNWLDGRKEQPAPIQKEKKETLALNEKQGQLRNKLIEHYGIKQGSNTSRDAQRKLNKLDGFKSVKFADLTDNDIRKIEQLLKLGDNNADISNNA